MEKTVELSETTFFPVLQYDDSTETRRTVYSTSGSYPSDFAVGQVVRLYYDPKHPLEVVIDSFWEKWGVASVLAMMAALDLLVAGLIYLLERLMSPAKPPAHAAKQRL